MADNEDYKELARLLADPIAWTREEAVLMRSILANQRDAVAACHPKDIHRRQQMTTVAEDIEAAVRRYDVTR